LSELKHFTLNHVQQFNKSCDVFATVVRLPCDGPAAGSMSASLSVTSESCNSQQTYWHVIMWISDNNAFRYAAIFQFTCVRQLS